MADKILVVDDDAPSRALISQCLQWLGFEIEQAATGREAIDKLAHENVQLVLSDVTMPEVDGFVLATYMQIKFPATPIILMSGNSSDEARQHARDVGVRHFLSKPMDLDELLAKIRELLALQEL